MYAKRFSELLIVTTAPYDLGEPLAEWERDLLFNRVSFDDFGSADCSCDICNGQN